MVWDVSAVGRDPRRGRAGLDAITFVEKVRLGPGLGKEASFSGLEKWHQHRSGGGTSLGQDQREWGGDEETGVEAWPWGIMITEDPFLGQSFERPGKDQPQNKPHLGHSSPWCVFGAGTSFLPLLGDWHRSHCGS